MVSDILSVFNYMLMLIPSLIYMLVLKVRKQNVWLIFEDKNTARDNGYYLFKYIRNNHPNDLAYYVISKKAKDYNKVSKLGNVINYGSLKHYLYYMVGIKITTNENSYPSFIFKLPL